MQYRDEIIAIMDKQIAKGYDKYGKHLEDNPRTLIEAVEAACEEQMDTLFYMREIINKIKMLQAELDTCRYYNDYMQEQVKVLRHGQK